MVIISALFVLVILCIIQYSSCSPKTYSIQFFGINDSNSVDVRIENGITTVLSATVTPQATTFDFQFNINSPVQVDISGMIPGDSIYYLIYDNQSTNGNVIYSSKTFNFFTPTIPNDCALSPRCSLNIFPNMWPAAATASLYFGDSDSPFLTCTGAATSSNNLSSDFIRINFSTASEGYFEFYLKTSFSVIPITQFNSGSLTTSVVLPIAVFTSPSANANFRPDELLPIGVTFMPILSDFDVSLNCPSKVAPASLGTITANSGPPTDFSIPSGYYGACQLIASSTIAPEWVGFVSITIELYVLRFKIVPTQILNGKTFEILIVTLDGTSPGVIELDLDCEGLGTVTSWPVSANVLSTLLLDVTFPSPGPYSCAFKTVPTRNYNEIVSQVAVLIPLSLAQQSQVAKSFYFPPRLVDDN